MTYFYACVVFANTLSITLGLEDSVTFLEDACVLQCRVFFFLRLSVMKHKSVTSLSFLFGMAKEPSL